MVQKESQAERRPRGRPRKVDPETALNRARNAFWDTGYAATSLDDLSAATGLNRPSLYSSFGDKQALYLASLKKSRAELTGSLTAALKPEEPLRVALERVFGAASLVYTQGERAQRGCFLIGTAVTEAVADPEIRGELKGALDEIDALFAARLARARAAGELAPTAGIDGLAKLATATLNGMAVRARAGGDLDTVAAFGEALVDTICGPR